MDQQQPRHQRLQPREPGLRHAPRHLSEGFQEVSQTILQEVYKASTKVQRGSLGKAPPKFSGEITEHYKKNEKTKKQIKTI